MCGKNEGCGSKVGDDFFLREAGFWRGGVFIISGAVAEGAGDGGGVAGGVEVEDFIIIRGGDAFERAGVYADEGGGGHELAEGDVDLAGVPCLALGGAHVS